MLGACGRRGLGGICAMSTEDTPGRNEDGEVQGPVTLTYDIEVMQTELTWAEYDRTTSCLKGYTWTNAKVTVPSEDELVGGPWLIPLNRLLRGSA